MTPDDPFVCLLQAVMQLRMYPGTQNVLLEDSHTCNMMILNITLNPTRKNVIYNCSRQSGVMPSELPDLELMGFPVEYVTYEAFKEKCVAMGEASPRHGYWVLLDHYASYWVRQKRCPDPYPIDISTCEEDCVPLPPRPNGLVFGITPSGCSSNRISGSTTPKFSESSLTLTRCSTLERCSAKTCMVWI